jgi:uncharacterized protein YggE
MEANIRAQTQSHRKMGRSRWIVNAAAVAALTFSLVGVATAQTSPTHGVTVNGVGTAYGAPDTAVLDLGVSLFNSDVSAGLSDVDERMVSIRAALVAMGIQPSDIRTTGLSVWREQQYDPQGNPIAERYNIWHNYNVTVRDPEQVGAVINAAVAAGANNIGGVNFTIADPSVLERSAREDAIADARERAEHLAELMGVTLGAPIAIAEGYQGYVPTVRSAAYDMGGAGVATGELAVTVNVTVTFALESADTE